MEQILCVFQVFFTTFRRFHARITTKYTSDKLVDISRTDWMSMNFQSENLSRMPKQLYLNIPRTQTSRLIKLRWLLMYLSIIEMSKIETSVTVHFRTDVHTLGKNYLDIIHETSKFKTYFHSHSCLLFFRSLLDNFQLELKVLRNGSPIHCFHRSIESNRIKSSHLINFFHIYS